MKTSGKVVGHHGCIGMLIVLFFYEGGGEGFGVVVSKMIRWLAV